MLHLRPLARFERATKFLAIALLALSLATVVHARGVFENHSIGFRFAAPAGWSAEEELDDDDSTNVLFTNATGDAAIAVAAGPMAAALDADDLAAFERYGLAGIVGKAVTVMLRGLPDWQVTNTYATSLAGIEALAVDYVAADLGGSILLMLDAGTMFVIASFAVGAAQDETQARYETVLASFERLAAPAGGAGGNPLTPTNPVASADPFAGTFQGDALPLTLERAGAAYFGDLSFGDQVFAVSAEAQGMGLTGTFVSAGNPFAFTATLDGVTMTFVTGGASYTLHR